jgi:hypothetical protein
MTNKTAIATISGEAYRIADSEGRAIASFTPPQLIKDIDWDTLTDAQTWLLSEMVFEWEVIAHWLVYYRTRAVDIKRMPFIHPEFLNRRAKAELYNIQLDLCAAIWEAIEFSHHYQTPYCWWIKCITENQQSQVKSILLSRDSIAKGETEDKLRILRRSLEKGIITFTKSDENIHLYRMFDSAISMGVDNKLVKKLWSEYLKGLGKLAKELKDDGETKAITNSGGHLYYRDRHTLKRIPVNRIKKDTVLNIRAKFALPA